MFFTELGEIYRVALPDLHLADGINDVMTWSAELSYWLPSISEFKKFAVVEHPVAPLSELFDLDLIILLGPLVPEIWLSMLLIPMLLFCWSGCLFLDYDLCLVPGVFDFPDEIILAVATSLDVLGW